MVLHVPPRPSPPAAPAWRRRTTLAGLAVLALVLAAPWLGRLDWGLLDASAAHLRTIIRSWGVWAPVASMLLMITHSVLPFPAEMLAAANGMVFGLAAGTAVTWTGAMLGAALAFAVARRLGRPAVRRLVGEGPWRRIEAWTERAGVGGLLLARLAPVISFNLVNYAAGLAGVGWWTFLWTTGLGILPVTVASVLVGSHMLHAPWWLWAGLVAAVGLSLIAGPAWRARRRNRLS